ncbi:6-bladed beta-propeller [Acidobacteriota bacterium]
MNCKLFNSKFLTILTLCLFVFLLASEGSAATNIQTEETFAQMIKEGESFYKSKEYEKAIIRYLEAYMKAKDDADFADVYLRLSMAYSANMQREKAKDYLLKLLEIQPDKQIDEQNYPPDFVILYYQAKIESLKPAAEEPKPTPEKEAKKEEPKKTVVKKEEPQKATVKQEEPKPKTEKKKPATQTTTKETKPKPSAKEETTIAKKEPAKPTVEPKKEQEKKDKATEKEPLPEKLKELPGVEKKEETKKESVKKEEPKKLVVEETKKEPVVKTQVASDEKVEKKKKIPWLLIGGLVVVGGALAYLLLGGKSSEEEAVATTGSIQVNSTPAEAMVFLDGSDTGQVTNTTLTGVSAGSHEIRVAKEGYVDYEESVHVSGGGTATLNANLSKHTINVTSPSAGAVLIKGTPVQIRWSTGGGNNTFANSSGSSHFNQLISEGGSSRNFIRLKVYREREAMRGHSQNPHAKRGNDGDGLAGVRKVIDELANVKERTAMRPQGTQTVASTPSGNLGSLNLNPKTQANPDNVSPADSAIVQTISEVKIDLYENGQRVKTIVNRTNNDGLFNWTIGPNIEDGVEYKIRVSAADASSVFGASKIFSIKTDYEFTQEWGTKGSSNGQFDQPVGVAAKQNKVFVMENVNSRISIFTPQGAFLSKWGSPGKSNDHFNGPIGVAVDNAGNIYIADTGNERIMKFTQNGVFVRKWGKRGGGNGQFRSPSGIAVDKQGNIYVADSYNFRIQKFDSDGNFLAKWGTRGSSDNQFGLPTGVAIDKNGNVFVADTENHRIMKFTSTGNFLTKWGSQGKGDDRFDQPSGVAVDSAGNVFVSDSENHRIMKFNATGKLLVKWGSRGDGNKQFRYPAGIAVDEQGSVYVADSGNYRIMKFSQL